MVTIEETLEASKHTHGDFKVHALITQSIKLDMKSGPNWKQLNSRQKESLEMVAHKIGRILAGDPNESDHWHDIAGYAMLVEQELRPA